MRNKRDDFRLDGYRQVKNSLRWARSDDNPEYNGGGNARQIVRYAHGYKWFGEEGMSAQESLENDGIACKCIDLEEFKYECYAPDPEFDDCCVHFITTEGYIEESLTKNENLADFLIKSRISMVEFKLMDIIYKLWYICRYYDIVEFLELGNIDAIPIEDIVLND